MIVPRWALVFFSVVALAAMASCSRDEGAASAAPATALDGAAAASRTASCDRVATSSVCSEYTGSYLAANEAVLSSSCAKLTGAFAGAECPNTTVLGSCALSTTEIRKFYASGGAAFDAVKAQRECTESYKGRWAALR